MARYLIASGTDHFLRESLHTEIREYWSRFAGLF